MTRRKVASYDINQECSESDSSTSDMSISTERSVSPYTSSSDSPPPPSVEVSPFIRSPPNADIPSAPSGGDSLCRRVTDSTKTDLLDSSKVACTDEVDENKKMNKLSKKTARTNFTNEQVKALMKIFYETPYPESEMMENIGKDLNITEKTG
ncbi:uncharacterized protein LOC132715266 [Ruditapes philippinarum]|uniref:uncharacterized protein LOC132715266 n=1 Tax=Ruditapes philippinarum TaxID=129788 RepID=UPI00295A5B6E|nr:uncharacterized protein LOC132715266 [Ruditapes philippinarum]